MAFHPDIVYQYRFQLFLIVLEKQFNIGSHFQFIIFHERLGKDKKKPY